MKESLEISHGNHTRYRSDDSSKLSLSIPSIIGWRRGSHYIFNQGINTYFYNNNKNNNNNNNNHYYYYYYYYYYYSFFLLFSILACWPERVLLKVFYLNLWDKKSPHVSRTLLSLFASLKNSNVYIISLGINVTRDV